MEATDVDPLRPACWDEFVGQARAKDELDVAITSSLERLKPLGHVLLAGPAGFGKTSLATIIAGRLSRQPDQFEAVSMAGMNAVGMSRLFRTNPMGVLLLDEIHAANKAMQDMLLTLLEDGYVMTPGGQKLLAPWLCVVGATTEKEKLTPALRQRFEHQPRFVDYTHDEMAVIVTNMATKIGVDVDEDMAATLGGAAGGIPRNARRLVRKLRDLRLARRPASPTDVLRHAGVDADGVTDEHLDYLAALDKAGGVAGLDTLRMLLTLHESDVRELERFLLQRGLIMYGAVGRELTTAGARKLRGNQPLRQAS